MATPRNMKRMKSTEMVSATTEPVTGEKRRWDPESLIYEDRLNVAGVFRCLIEISGLEKEGKAEVISGLCDRLLIKDTDRAALEQEVQRDRDPVLFASAIQDVNARAQLLYDLLALSVASGQYSAREREGLRKIALAMHIPWKQVVRAEDELLRQLWEQRKELAAAPKAQQPSSGRWWKIALAAVAAAVVAVFTGGTAAPAIGGFIGTYFMGLSGAAATSAGLAFLGGGSLAAGGFGMAGGTTVIATLFGATGAGIVAKKTARLTGALEEFEFELLGGDGAHVHIAVSGFLSEGEDAAQAWAGLERLAGGGRRYVLRWESKRLLDLGYLFTSLAGKRWAKSAATAWARRACKKAAQAIAWPVAALSFADFIDNPWHLAVNRAEKAGLELAKALLDKDRARLPVTLIGFSLGARVVFYALEELVKRAQEEPYALHVVDHAIMMGGAFTADPERWAAVKAVVAGRLIDAYCTSDWILGFLYRAAQLRLSAAGLAPVDCPAVESIDVTDLAGGHLGYCDNLEAILRRIGADGSTSNEE
jgi:hypothetical protein